MQHIKNMLSARVQSSGLSNQIKVAQVIEKAEFLLQKYFGAEIAKSIKPLYVKNNILTLACLHTAYAMEIKLKKQQLLEDLNKDFNSPVVKDVRLVL